MTAMLFVNYLHPDPVSSDPVSFRKLAQERFGYNNKYKPENSSNETDPKQRTPTSGEVHKTIDKIESTAHKEKKKK